MRWQGQGRAESRAFKAAFFLTLLLAHFLLFLLFPLHRALSCPAMEKVACVGELSAVMCSSECSRLARLTVCHANRFSSSSFVRNLRSGSLLLCVVRPRARTLVRWGDRNNNTQLLPLKKATHDFVIFTMMRRPPGLIAWPLIAYLCFFFCVVAKESTENDNVRLRVSIRKDTLKGVQSIQHTFSQIELLNLVSLPALLGWLF